MGSRSSFFDLVQLRAFLEFARSCRPVAPFRDWDGGNALLLRHDVDIDLGSSTPMAEAEVAAGVRSTFFVMVSSELYNAAAPEGRAVIRDLAGEGFEIGLHFWPAAYEAGADLVPIVAREAKLLEDLCGQPVSTVSLHNPSALSDRPLFSGFRNAYDAETFSPERYLSDSRMVLREDPYEFVRRTTSAVAQLLLHPEHFTASNGGYDEIFVGIERRRAASVDRYMSVNESYRALLPDGLFATLEKHAHRTEDR